MKNELIIHEMPKHPVSEAIRSLRTNITYKMSKTNEKVFLITSSSAGEGKSWTSSNLAVAFCQSKQKVLLIDADIRKGKQHKTFSINNDKGLSDLLKELATNNNYTNLDNQIGKYIIKSEIDNLSLITCGSQSHSPAELLDNDNFKLILDNLKDKYDLIIVDAPPVNIVTDPLILCNKVDSTILVCAINKTKSELLVEAKRKIRSMDGKILGVVINRMPSDKMKEYTKNYYNYNNTQIIRVGQTTFKNKGIS